MQRYDYLIIGGGITGVSAAETIRETEPAASIALVTSEPHPLYSRVLLPSYLKNRINRGQVFLRTLEDFTKKQIDLRTSEEASFIDTKKKEILFLHGQALGFGKLLIASGGRVLPWGEKQDQQFIYRLQTIDDADRLRIAMSGIRQPVVIGTSFIALELLEIFLLNKVTPTLLARDRYFFANILDPQGAGLLAKNFEAHGIIAHFADSIQTMVPEGDHMHLATVKGEKIECDAIGAGVGIERSTGFLAQSGITLGKKGIQVNEYLETNIPGIFAAGDVAEFFDVIVGTHRVIGNWTNAFLQGKRAGLNMAGMREPFRSVSAYSITNMGMQITALGDSRNELETVTRIDEKHPTYERLFLKDGVLVGAVLINKFKDKPHLSSLIEHKVSIEPFRASLQDPSFDIHLITL